MQQIKRLSFSVLLAGAACQGPNTSAPAYPDATFRPDLWRKDSTACGSYRKSVHWTLLRDKAYFIGQPLALVQQLLGPPSFRTRVGWFYAVECVLPPPPPAGLPNTRPATRKSVAFLSQYVAVLLFEAKRDTCRGVRGLIP
jgi:hypothetical protein